MNLSRINPLLALLAALAVSRAGAADVLREGEASLAHFAFASQLGSGIYSFSGRTLQIYRLPFGWQASEPEGRRPGLRLGFPTTIGLYDFEARDMIESGLPDQLDTFTTAVGAEFDFVLGDWHLLPYFEAGRAWDAGGNADATIYSAALRARRELPRENHVFRLNAGIVYAGVELDGTGGKADMLKLEAGFESRRLLDFTLGGQPAEGGVYLLAEWYPDRPEEPVVRSAGRGGIPAQGEIGLTLGTRPRLKIWGLPFPRVGLAYRFGENLKVYRLVLGAPF